ncbi:unnamed protein product [Ranitomeya imitator]|uniref:Uncharacterized protein n=1 Tax=Ranitomeya imitator TaxID=111125 RepID=A0ABN9LGR0_9NEOB|nr:unnamed protein product [Ranitomeya imitator]
MAVWRRHPSNIRDLEQFAKEEWSKIPAEHCKKLIDGYRKRLCPPVGKQRNTHGPVSPNDWLGEKDFTRDSPRAINNLRRSNSTTQVTPGSGSLFSGEQREDFLAFFESSSMGRKKLHGLAKTPPEKKATWNILDDQPRAFPVPSSARSASSVQSLSMKRRDMPALAPNFPANNRSNKGTVGNTVTTMVHNNYSSGDRGLAAKSSNQKPPSLNNQRTPNGEESGSSFQKSQKNLSGTNNLGRNNAEGNGAAQRRKEVTAEEAERFILQVNNAAITIQRWYRRQRQKRRSGEEALRHMLASKKEERQHQADDSSHLNSHQSKDNERKRIREEKARQARRAAVQVVPLVGLTSSDESSFVHILLSFDFQRNDTLASEMKVDSWQVQKLRQRKERSFETVHVMGKGEVDFFIQTPQKLSPCEKPPGS